MLKEHNFAGKLIAVCGTDGAGKTTLIEGLSQFATEEGYSVLITKQPTPETRRHPLFYSYLYEPEKRKDMDYQALLALMVMDRLQHISEVIVPALKAGKVVISDRYVFTMIANMRARGFNEDWVYKACEHILEPDATFLCTADLDQVIHRIRQRETFEGSYVEKDLLARSQQEYLWCAKTYGLDIINSSQMSIQDCIDAATSKLKSVFQEELTV